VDSVQAGTGSFYHPLVNVGYTEAFKTLSEYAALPKLLLWLLLRNYVSVLGPSDGPLFGPSVRVSKF